MLLDLVNHVFFAAGIDVLEKPGNLLRLGGEGLTQGMAQVMLQSQVRTGPEQDQQGGEETADNEAQHFFLVFHNQNTHYGRPRRQPVAPCEIFEAGAGTLVSSRSSPISIRPSAIRAVAHASAAISERLWVT
jgi:hypothetical protein